MEHIDEWKKIIISFILMFNFHIPFSEQNLYVLFSMQLPIFILFFILFLIQQKFWMITVCQIQLQLCITFF